VDKRRSLFLSGLARGYSTLRPVQIFNFLTIHLHCAQQEIPPSQKVSSFCLRSVSSLGMWIGSDGRRRDLAAHVAAQTYSNQSTSASDHVARLKRQKAVHEISGPQ
jgi:hypothetical protein